MKTFRKMNAWDWVVLALFVVIVAVAVVSGVVLFQSKDAPTVQDRAVQTVLCASIVFCFVILTLVECIRHFRDKKIWAIAFILVVVGLAVAGVFLCRQLYDAALEADALDAAYKEALAADAENFRELWDAADDAEFRVGRITRMLSILNLGFELVFCLELIILDRKKEES